MRPPPEINPLLVELIAAHRNARREDLADALDACGLRQTGGPIFGVEFVAIDPHHYVPEPGGRPAVILPFFDGGSLVDLVAVGLATRTSCTRTSICVALGMEHIEQARETETAVRIFADPLEWLASGRHGACIVDWRAIRHVLADVPAVTVDSEFLAARIDKAMRQPVCMPQITVHDRKAAVTAKHQAETAARAEWAAKTAQYKVKQAKTETHPYLATKGFPKALGLVHEGLLLVPARLDGRVVSLQEIAADGTTSTLAGWKAHRSRSDRAEVRFSARATPPPCRLRRPCPPSICLPV